MHQLAMDSILKKAIYNEHDYVVLSKAHWDTFVKLYPFPWDKPITVSVIEDKKKNPTYVLFQNLLFVIF